MRADFPRRSRESAASANATARTKSVPSAIPTSTLATIPNIDVLIAHRTHRQVSHRRADDHRHPRHDIDSVLPRVIGAGWFDQWCAVCRPGCADTSTFGAIMGVTKVRGTSQLAGFVNTHPSDTAPRS